MSSEDPPLTLEDVLQAEREAITAASGADPQAPRSALCISGGGIRSATFALGALQGMAAHGLLGRFDYLSTVSGGGYIGSWLTAWIHRAKGLDNVAPQLARDSAPQAAGRPDPIGHLRAYNSYLTPRSGALSWDLWAVLATALRNILLNWIVLLPLLAAALMVPRIYLSILSLPEFVYADVIFATEAPNYGASELNAFADSLWVKYVVPLAGLLLLVTALFNTLRYLPGVGAQPHTAADYTRKVMVPLVGAVLMFLVFDCLYYLGRNYVAHSNLWPILSGVSVACLMAWLAFLVQDPRSAAVRLRLLASPVSLGLVAMAAGVGVSAWLATNFVLWNPDPHLAPSWAEYVTLGPPTILLGYWLGTVFFVGLTSAALKDEDREWLSRATGGALLFAALWAAVCAMVLVLPKWALDWHAWAHGALAAATAASAWLSTLGGGTSGNGGGRRLVPLAIAAAPVVFLLLLAGALSVATNMLIQGLHELLSLKLDGVHGKAIQWSNHYGMLTQSEPWLVVGAFALLLLVSVTTARLVNTNTFSLNGMYRNRLVRAYLGASQADRRPSPFTGFSNDDDVAMAAIDPRQRPFHVLNLTLNLVGEQRLAWQQRKATAFTVSPLHSGSAGEGFRPSAQYAGGISLGTAMAISGAAASPSMGCHSTPLVGFIMTLFNARLGAWLGHPGAPGALTWTRPGPSLALRSLVTEALGATSDHSPYVYLSDGGHFENLAVYEMVRRGCRWIVVLDGGCDPDFVFEDLGNALRKVRIDLGVSIEFDEEHMKRMRQRQQRWAMATIVYAQHDGGADGRLLYIKPMVLGYEPPDVSSYAAANPSFPHQGTGDQWFNESQTESYRELGRFTLDTLCREAPAAALPEWLDRLAAGAAGPQRTGP